MRRLLGGLSQFNTCHVLDFELMPDEHDHGVTISNLNLTRRGAFCLDGFIDSFTYLQLIIDDFRLDLPSSLRDEYFKYSTVDYSYLVAPSSEYGAIAKKMVIEKMTKIFVFLEMLSIALRRSEGYIAWYLQN